MVQLELAGRRVQPISGLASLPETAIACVFLQLRSEPGTAANLAQTCCACALEFAVQHSLVIKQKCWDLRPGCTFFRAPGCTHAVVTIRWLRVSVLGRLYALSAQTEAVEAMWGDVFAKVFKHILADIEPQGDRRALTDVEFHVMTSAGTYLRPNINTHHARELHAAAHARFQKGLAMQRLPVRCTFVSCPRRIIDLYHTALDVQNRMGSRHELCI